MSPSIPLQEGKECAELFVIFTFFPASIAVLVQISSNQKAICPLSPFCNPLRIKEKSISPLKKPLTGRDFLFDIFPGGKLQAAVNKNRFLELSRINKFKNHFALFIRASYQNFGQDFPGKNVCLHNHC